MNRSNRYGVLVLRRIGLSFLDHGRQSREVEVMKKDLRQFDRTKMEQ